MRKKSLIGLGLAVFLLLSAGTWGFAAGDPQATADVIYSGGFWGIAGHLSLYGAGKMLEVMGGNEGVNNTCVYNYRDLQAITGFGYLGAKYDRRLSKSTLLKIMDAGLDQSNRKAEYNLLLNVLKFMRSSSEAWVVDVWNFNKLKKKQTRGSSVLRCDFFVAASYKEAGGTDLSGSWWNPIFIPLTVWWQMPDER